MNIIWWVRCPSPHQLPNPSFLPLPLSSPSPRTLPHRHPPHRCPAGASLARHCPPPKALTITAAMPTHHCCHHWTHNLSPHLTTQLPCTSQTAGTPPRFCTLPEHRKCIPPWPLACAAPPLLLHYHTHHFCFSVCHQGQLSLHPNLQIICNNAYAHRSLEPQSAPGLVAP